MKTLFALIVGFIVTAILAVPSVAVVMVCYAMFKTFGWWFIAMPSFFVWMLAAFVTRVAIEEG